MSKNKNLVVYNLKCNSKVDNKKTTIDIIYNIVINKYKIVHEDTSEI